MIFSVACSIFILDMITKFIAVKSLVQGQSVKVLHNIFHITLVFNDGTAFGLFRGKREFFILLSLMVIIFMIVFIRRHKVRDAVLSIALGLILGGACGNLADRIRFGYVIDFFDLRVWPVFNVADSAVTVGVAIILLKILYKGKGQRAKS